MCVIVVCVVCIHPPLATTLLLTNPILLTPYLILPSTNHLHTHINLPYVQDLFYLYFFPHDDDKHDEASAAAAAAAAAATNNSSNNAKTVNNNNNNSSTASSNTSSLSSLLSRFRLRTSPQKPAANNTLTHTHTPQENKPPKASNDKPIKASNTKLVAARAGGEGAGAAAKKTARFGSIRSLFNASILCYPLFLYMSLFAAL